MPAIPRAHQKIFGSSLTAAGNLAVIGSLQAGAPAFTDDPATMQSLANFLQGFNGIVVGNRSPTQEDMNSLLWLITRQLAYLLQSGIPEYSAATTYYVGNVVRVGNVQYTSLTDDNVGNAVTNTNHWIATTGSLPAAAAMSASQSVAVDGSGHTLTMDVATIDPFDCYSGSTYRYTAPVAGIYAVTANVQIDNVDANAAATDIACRAVVNGTVVALARGYSVPNPGTNRWYPSLGGIIQVSAGDTVEIQIAANDGGSGHTFTVSNSDWSIRKV